MLSVHDFQDRLVLEKVSDDTCTLVAQWGNSPKGWELLTRQMILLQSNQGGKYHVRPAEARDDLSQVPTILRHLQ